MSTLDPRIEAVRAKYDLDKSAFWQIPQNKQWVVKHAALEVVATKAGIIWSLPQVIEANTDAGIAVMAVSGQMGERVEWATGEASPKNNRNSYPWAMAEKRAKDRVVLKLAGIHGLVYSEDEADDFKAPVLPPQNEPDLPQRKSSASLKRDDAWGKLMTELTSDLMDCHSLASLAQLRATYREKAREAGWPRAWLEALANEFDTVEEALQKIGGDA